MNATQNLAVDQIKSAELGDVPGRRVFRVIRVRGCGRLVGMYRLATPLQIGMRKRMGQCAVLRNQQQGRQRKPQPARAQCPSRQCGKAHGLFADGNRISQAVIQPHRVITQHRETPGYNDRFETIFDRRFGLHLDHLLRAAGQAE